MTAKQIRTAARIDNPMQPLLRAGKDDVAILTGMSDYMMDFKDLMDTAKPGVMDELCQRYPVRRHQGAKINKKVTTACRLASSVARPSILSSAGLWCRTDGISINPSSFITILSLLQPG